MVKHNKKTFEVDTWSDVFDEVSLTKLPFKYIDTILINFKDKTTWELGITSTHTPKELESFEDGFKEILETYDEFISDIDVKVNTKHVKRDVKKSIKRIFKKLKLWA